MLLERKNNFNEHNRNLKKKLSRQTSKTFNMFTVKEETKTANENLNSATSVVEIESRTQ